MEQTSKLSTKEILSQNLKRTAPKGMQQLSVILHNVRSMHNVGAAFRNADAFGIKKLYLSGFTPKPPRPEISKTAIGAEEFVDWMPVADIEGKIIELKMDNYMIVGLEQTDKSILLPEYSPSLDAKICLVFGNEVTGLDEDLIPLIDEFIEIPQFGNKHSLNVSVSVGITLYGFLEKYWS